MKRFGALLLVAVLAGCSSGGLSAEQKRQCNAVSHDAAVGLNRIGQDMQTSNTDQAFSDAAQVADGISSIRVAMSASSLKSKVAAVEQDFRIAAVEFSGGHILKGMTAASAHSKGLLDACKGS